MMNTCGYHRPCADVNAKRNLLLRGRTALCEVAGMKDIPTKTRMRAWRGYRGLTQDEVAEPVGWTRQAIAQIERGSSDITIAKLAIICKRAFRTDLRTFFGPLPGRERAA